MKIYPINEMIEVHNYPYGGMRTNVYFSIEFDAKKGFRTVFQSVNPKNSRLNAPKKSTYSTLQYNYLDPATGHVKQGGFGVTGYDDVNKISQFIAENFDALQLTPEMVKSICGRCIVMINANARFTQVEDRNKLIEILKKAVAPLAKGYKEGTNVFAEVNIDIEEINKMKK